MKMLGILFAVILVLIAPVSRAGIGSTASEPEKGAEVVTLTTDDVELDTESATDVATTSATEATTVTEAATEVATESIDYSSTVDVAYNISDCGSTEIGTGYNHPASYANYSDDDKMLLAKLIYTEAGCKWISDEVQLAVGSVVLNRVNSDLYPNNIRDVLDDPNQYEMWVFDYMEVDEEQFARAYSNAETLLTYGSKLPSDVLGQNSTKEGYDTYDEYHDPELGTAIYFTYIYG